MPFSRDDKQHRADQFRQQVEEQLVEEHAGEGEGGGEINNNENEEPCCVPMGCTEGGPVHTDDPDDCQRVVCNNPECTEGKFMHKICFDTWEDEVLTYLRSSGRARSWSEKQRRQNLWTKKGYDLAWKACSCKCGKGHLRKDLEWIPPKLPEGAAAENAQQRRHRRRKKSNEKPSIGRANSISSGNGNGGNGNGHGGNGHGRLRHASASSTASTESNHTPPPSPSMYQGVLSQAAGAGGKNPPRFPAHSSAATAPTTPTTTSSVTSVSSAAATVASTQPVPAASAALTSHAAQSSSQSQSQEGWKQRQHGAGGSGAGKNQSQPSHHFIPPLPQQYTGPPPTHHDYHSPPMSVAHHQGNRQPPPPNRSSQFHHGGGPVDFRGQSERGANMQAYNSNFFSNVYWNPAAENVPGGGGGGGGASSGAGSGSRGFLPRLDLSAFYQVLPAHKLNSYHIKMEEDSQPEAEEIRSFIFATLNIHGTRVIPCSVCARKLPVFDRYPLIDGTFYLTPQRQGDGSKGLQVGLQGSQYLNAVCMQCLEGVQRIVCRICKSRWDGSHHQLGTLYSYDIFAAYPCCPGRAGCKRCGKPVIDPTRGTHFFSEYSRSIQCPHCGVPDFHFVKPLSSYEVHSNSVQQINVC